MTFAANDFEAIRRRQEELKAERDLALTGSTIAQHDAATGETVEYTLAKGWPMYVATDYDPA